MNGDPNAPQPPPQPVQIFRLQGPPPTIRPIGDVFTGLPGSDADAWIRKFEEQTTRNQWPVGDRVQFFEAQLSSTAQEWFLLQRELGIQFDDWDALKTAFLNQFRSEDVARDVVTRVYDRKQASTENVETYLLNMQRL